MPEDPPDVDRTELTPLAELVARGLQRIENDGLAAIDELCAEHPELADELRARFASLAQVGLLQSARRFGRYRILRKIGHGGMGVVYLADDDELERVVALKTLPARFSVTERALERFRREIMAAAKLRHPSIVPIHDVGEEDGTPFFTMEFVEGRSLAARLGELRGRGTAPDAVAADALGVPSARSHIEAACQVAIAVAEGLDHAHQHEVIHRDVKPDNILIGTDGRTRLVDFGLANVDGEPSMTTTGDFAGTTYYASPEQVSRERATLDARTDVHALGATLYEMLTLERPFTGPNAAAVIRRIESEDPVPPRQLHPAVPRDLETITMTALRKRPELRYASAGAMAADLRRFLRGLPVQARPIGPLTRVARFAARRPALATAALLAIVIAVGTPIGLWRTNLAIRAERDRAEHEAEAARDALARAASESARADVESERAETVEQNTSRRAAMANAFLQAILVSNDPLVDDRHQTVLQMLYRAATLASFPEDPPMEAEVRRQLAHAFALLGLYDDAALEFSASWEALDRSGHVLPGVRFRMLRGLVMVLQRQGRHAEAQAVVEGAIALGTELYGPTHPSVLGALNELARSYFELGDVASARATFQRVLAGARAARPRDDRLIGRTLHNYALTLEKSEEALSRSLMKRAADMLRDQLPDDDLEAAIQITNAMWADYDELGPTDEDIDQVRHALGVLRTRVGDQSKPVADACLLLAKLLRRRPGFDPVEIEALMQEAIATYAIATPGKNPRIAALAWLSAFLREHGRSTEALPLTLEAIAARKQLPEPIHRPPLEVLVAQLVLLLRDAGQDSQAEQLLADIPGARPHTEAGILVD